MEEELPPDFWEGEPAGPPEAPPRPRSSDDGQQAQAGGDPQLQILMQLFPGRIIATEEEPGSEDEPDGTPPLDPDADDG